MNEDSPDHDDLLDFLAEEARDRPDPEEHPSIETLSAYGMGKLSEEESDRIQDHLVACRECSALVLSHKELLRVQAEPAPAVAPVVPFEAKRREPTRFVWPAYALAAVFAVATLGLTFYSLSLRSRLLTPVANPPRVELFGTERGSSRPPVKLVSGKETALFFWLERPYGDPSSEYIAEIHTQRGGPLIRVPNLAPERDGLSFVIYSDQLESGSYEIILKHPDGTKVRTYQFDIARP